jgi:lipoprotein-anchoring transpeptidase ErfK/SrfK
VSAAHVAAFVPPAPRAGHAGHWVDINLSASYAVAYDGTTPLYAAIVRTGGPGFETPTGEFTIFHRVESETMDAATVGILPTDPEYYYVPDVRHTQYFAAGGYALHGNHWSPPTAFGQPGSHGCVNLLPPDAAWFWKSLAIGSPVSIHD